MRCEAFRRRMHQRLDARLSLEADDPLRRHADACPGCRSELEAWRQIAAVLPATSPAPAEPPVAGGDPATPPRRTVTAGRPEPQRVGGPRRVGGPPRAGRLGRAGGRAAIGLAASVLVWWGLQSPHPVRHASSSRQPPQAVAPAQTERVLAYPQPPADPEQWWNRMRQRQWLDSAIPAARSVGEGVAPLGRSLLQAVAILAHGQGTGTS